MSRPDIPVTIGADDREFKGAMTRIRMQARTAANDTASSFLSIKSKIGGADSLVGMLAGGPGGLAASLGLGSFVAATQQAVDAVTDLGKAAKTAGVDFEAFQELRYAAVKSKIGVDALTDGLKEMQLRADEFVKTGGGSAAESFQRLGLSARQLTRMLDDPASMFETLIGKIRQLDRAAQIRVLDEIFGGTAAEDFSALMDEAGQSIADARQEARDMGAVMDEELLQKAEDVNAEWEAMALVIGTRVKSSLVEVAGLVSGLVSNLGAFMTMLDQALQKAGNAGIWTKLGGALGVDMSQKMVWVDGQGWVPSDDAGNDVTEFPPVDVTVSRNQADDYADYNAGREILEQKLAANREVTAELQRQNGLTSDQIALEKEMAAVRKQYEDAGGAPTEEMVRQQAQARLDARGRRRDAGKAGGGGSAASVNREREAVEKLIQALRDELQMTEMGAEEKKVFENLRRAGAAATDSEKASIRELTLAIEDQKDKQQQAADTAGFFRDTARDSFMSLIPAIETGNDALDTLINKLIEAAAQAALFGDGPLGGLFGGGLLSGLVPAHATGTSFTQGGMALVGERGPEILNLPRGGEIIPNHRLGAVSSSTSSGSVISSVSIGDINVAVPEGTDPKDAVAMGKEFRKQIDAFVDKRLQENARARGMLAGGPF
ncbi:phage tail tape measure protein [Martelella endophytica]|uniref:phage tail tape measure protein n=1 Tax=Martelella endophytica TaxID=1486262 RepID=UPI000697556F|nr:phage tail tape measure protein [Martelella endophytica]